MGRKFVEERKPGPPAYMVSFGDMMTLILTFFILLVSMATERRPGLLAEGLGSFVVALESHGMPGIMSGEEKQEIFDNYRRRFLLPVEQDEERRIQHSSASTQELIRSKVLEALTPHGEIGQPSVAIFGPDSAQLDGPSRRYLDRLVDTLRPRAGQLLILEGHALDAGPAHSGDDTWLAYTRAEAVRDYLITKHNYVPTRVESRAWLREIEGPSIGTRSVDARLITPKKASKQ